MTAPIAAAMMVPAMHDSRFQYQQTGLNLLGRLARHQLKTNPSPSPNPNPDPKPRPQPPKP